MAFGVDRWQGVCSVETSRLSTSSVTGARSDLVEETTRPCHRTTALRLTSWSQPDWFVMISYRSMVIRRTFYPNVLLCSTMRISK